MTPEDRRDHPEAYTVPTEQSVPNEARALPSDRPTVYIITAVVTLLGIVGIIIAFPAGMRTLGLVLAILGLLLGILAIIMARGDARVTTIAPSLATIGGAGLTILIALTMAADNDMDRPEAGPAIGAADLTETDTGTADATTPDAADALPPAQPAAARSASTQPQ